jgi:hypothetical protein
MRQARATDSRHPRRPGDARPHSDVVPVVNVPLRLIHAIHTNRSVHEKLDVPYPSFDFVVGTNF